MPPAVRPDPAGGVFETMLVSDGGVLEIDAHFDRLSRSVRVLYGRTVDSYGAARLKNNELKWRDFLGDLDIDSILTGMMPEQRGSNRSNIVPYNVRWLQRP